MVKKLIALAGAGAMLLSVAGPVLAKPHHWMGGSSDVAIVENAAVAEANTGGNAQDDYATAGGFIDNDATAGSNGNRNMTTGDADAKAKAVVVANTHISCGPCASGGKGHKDFAMVGNAALAGANTGDNYQDDYATAGGFIDNDATAGSNGNRNMTTGDAKAKAKAWTVVNTHLGGGMPPVW